MSAIDVFITSNAEVAAAMRYPIQHDFRVTVSARNGPGTLRVAAFVTLALMGSNTALTFRGPKNRWPDHAVDGDQRKERITGKLAADSAREKANDRRFTPL